MRKPLQRTLLALITSGLCLSSWATVTASLDKTRVAVGERLRLVLVNTGSSDQQPDLTALKQDFDILGSQRGSNVQIANGHMTSQSQLTLLLAAKHDGTIRIAPITWGTEQSAPIELVVGAAAEPAKPGAQATESQITMSGTVDQKQPYVQGAVVLSLRLNIGAQMAQASLDFQGNSDVLVRQLGQDQQHQESRNGRTYQVIDRKYLLIPQRSGAISLKGPIFQAQVADEATAGNDPDVDAFFGNIFGQAMGRFGRAMRPIRLQAQAVEMNVLPRPATADATNWLPAQKLTLEENWRPPSGSVRVGEPVTRHLSLNALGVTAGQLPDLAAMMPVPDGIKKYPDQARNDDSLQGETLQAKREQDIALVATAPGHYVLPAMRLFWWDTTSHTQHTVELPERALDVLPAAGAGSSYADAGPGSGSPPPSGSSPGGSGSELGNPSAGSGSLGGNSLGSAWQQAAQLARTTPWMGVSAALTVLWLGTLLMWWRAYHAPGQTARSAKAAAAKPDDATAPRASTELAALQRACSSSDAKLARHHVLQWAASLWPLTPPRGLQDLAERLQDERFSEPLRQLDRACYTGTAWSGQALAQAFARPPKVALMPVKQRLLPELYA